MHVDPLFPSSFTPLFVGIPQQSVAADELVGRAERSLWRSLLNAGTLARPSHSMILYRPTGLAELKLVAAADWTAWPARLPDQPIFYPVLTLDYARKIARDWNAGDSFSGHIGFVTRFEIAEQAAARYPVQVAGGRSHGELWIPAEELADFNRHILGRIVVVESYPGPKYLGAIDPETHLPIGFADTHD